MKKIAMLASLMLLSACASIVDGKNQQMSVQSKPSGASCSLGNEAGKWYVTTPGSVSIQSGKDDLTVQCKKGDLKGTATVVSGVKDMAFGNILAGGLIGVAIDRSNGAAFKYPNDITVPLSSGGSVIRITPPEPKETEADTNPIRRR